MNPAPWVAPSDLVLRELGSCAEGLSRDSAAARLGQQKPPLQRRQSTLILLLAQFKSPLVLMLLSAALLSVVVNETTDALVILTIVVASTLLGFTQEHGATRAVEKLLALVVTRSTVLRDGHEVEIATDEVVPGDVVLLSAGAIVPGDCRILTSRDLHADEAALTGETFPVEKEPAPVAAEAGLPARRSMLYAGTHVVSGTGRAVVVTTGPDTELGQIMRRLDRRPPPSEFEHGVERFGIMIAQVTSLLALLILAANLALHRPWLESFLFSLALAVGLVPELLPAIVSVNLSRGARRMATAKVIVKRLSSIEDFGAIDVLCTDKTGTLTEGRVKLDRAVGADGKPSALTLRAAVLNACFESGLANPIDEALRRESEPNATSAVRKLDEVPYDFVRKRLSVLVEEGGQSVLLTKGAVSQILAICMYALDGSAQPRPIAELTASIEGTFRDLSRAGLRCLGVARKPMASPVAGSAGEGAAVSVADESAMTFLGFVAFLDPPKAGVAETVAELRRLGVSLKMITGDNAQVAVTVAERIGLGAPVVLTGRELRETSDEALARRAQAVDVFAEIEPNQKERIILSLRRAGHVVGYLGDGINDAPALHAAHVGISVDTAVDVAKEAAQIVLLQNNLAVLIEGVRLGRATLENTLKYIYITASANFGNMLS
ncbi:MAG TPA: HAD-IC family P-type ATPase, partial [Pseudomonadota bacterium]|nr:HAD-IC family P-type ATPase [Pseudomonadota bacterium]